MRARGRGMATKLLLVLAMSVAIGTLAPAHAEAASPDREMVSLINKSRAAARLKPLSLNTTLSKYAARHSNVMASQDLLHHNKSLARQLKHLPWRILGENVGVGPSIASLHPAFMASPSHRRNVLDRRFNKVGVGVVVRNGRTWVTVVFYG
jgi:uncharacterized protein YkwD